VPRWVRLVFLRHGVRLFGFCDHLTEEQPEIVARDLTTK